MVFHNETIQHLIPLLVLLIPLLGLFLRQTKKRDSDSQYMTPPYNSSTMIETFRGTSSPNLAQFFHKWRNKVGSDTYCIRQLRNSPPVVITGDLSLIREVLCDRNSLKSKGAEKHQLGHDGGPDMFTSEGKFWKHARKGMSPAFSQKNINMMITEIVPKHLQIVREVLDKHVKNQQPIDITKLMINFTMNAMCDALYEYTMDEEDKALWERCVPLCMNEIKKSHIPFRWKFGRFIPAVVEARKCGKEILGFGYKILNHYRSLEKRAQGRLLEYIENNENYTCDKEKASEIIVMIIAAHDTTAYTLSFLFKLLSIHQDYQETLRSELVKTAESDYPNLSLLHRIIKESMRTKVISPVGSARKIAKDIIVKKNEANGYKKDLIIPKGSTVICSFTLLHLNEKYHKDPLVFNPDRWIEPSDDAKGAFIPFSIGRRNCIGQTLAMSMIHNAFPSLVRDYKFTIADEGFEEFTIFYKPTNLLLNVTKHK